MSVNGEITAVHISKKSYLHSSREDIVDYEKEKANDEKRSRPPSGHQRPKGEEGARNREKSAENVLRADSDQIDLDKLLHSMLNRNEHRKGSSRSSREQKHRPSSAHCITTRAEDGRDSCVSNDSFGQRRTRSRPFSAHIEPDQRSNYSFSNSKVEQIDRENQRLLKALMRHQDKVKQPFIKKSEPFRVQSSATLNRFRQQQQIERENMAFMRRLETIKPTRELARDNLLREHFKQEQFAKNVSRSKRRPASAGTVGHSRKSRSISDLSSVDGESVASSRASFQRMQRTGSAKRPVSAKTKHIDNRPVWDAGW